MTAGSLSTLPSSVTQFGEENRRPWGAAAVVRPGAVAAGGIRTTRLDPHHVFQIPAPPQDEWPLHAVDAALRGSGLLEHMEYEARGLLNLVGFAARCLADADCRPDERLRWREELDRANARLEALYEAGLSRDFLTNPRRRERTGQGSAILSSALFFQGPVGSSRPL